MDYISLQDIVNNYLLREGDIVFAVSAAILLAVGIVTAIAAIWHKLRENKTLKYEFITIIAHKFRTPLTHVKWSTDNLLSEETDPYKKQSLADIHQSNERLIELTGTLIELADSDSKVKAGYKFERLPFCELARQTGDALKDSFHEKNIFFSVECPTDDIFVKADKTRFGFALQALLENALNYTQPGKNVNVIVSSTHRKAVVSVEDHGIGIDAKDMERIFSKFYRAENARKADTEGVGVGLYMARSIVRRHRGKIEVYSAGVGQGSTFKIVLPKVR